MPNGLRCALKNRSDLNSVTVSVWVKAGTADEPKEQRGVAHFLEHMLFSAEEGTGEIDRQVELLGGELNAATSYDYTYYYITLPAEHACKAVRLAYRLVMCPSFPETAFEKEKGVVLQEIARSKDDPHEVFMEAFMFYLYGEHPYGFPILGFKETVERIRKSDVLDFYTSLYTPENTAVSVVGRMDTGDVLKALESTFGSAGRALKERSAPLKAVGEPPKEMEFTVRHGAVVLPCVVVGWKLPGCGREDVYLEILDALFSSGRSSLLYRFLKERGIVHSAFSNYQALRLGSNFYIFCVTEKVDACLKELKALVERVADTSKEEFELARDKLYRAEVFARESGSVEADAVGYAVAVMDDLEYFTGYLDRLKSADYGEFLRALSFMEEEPVTGLLINTSPLLREKLFSG